MKPVPFESFSYPFFDFTYKADYPSLVAAFLNPPSVVAKRRGHNGLYVHVPFCDTICSFCPFVKSVGSQARIADYLKALYQEMAILGRDSLNTSRAIDTIYVGGGTPSVLSELQIIELFNSIRANFKLSFDCEISFETEAKSTTREKLLCLKSVGVTRVSFGLQTFDKLIQPHLNITATEDQHLNTIALMQEIFPRRNNLDVLIGLPGQSMDSMYKDLDRVVGCGISSISIYPMDYVMTLPNFLEKIRAGVIPAPAESHTRSEMFYNARKHLAKRHEEHNIYCYGETDTKPCKFMFELMYGGYYDEYIGLGVGAYSAIRGVAYQNSTSERDYIEALSNGRRPVRVASPYHAYEKGLVFFPKRMSYDSSELDQLYLTDIYSDKFRRLVEDGYVRKQGSLLSLTPLGEKHYAALMVEFFSESQSRLYSMICEKLHDQVGWAASSQIPDRKPKVRTMGAHTAMNEASASSVLGHA